MESIEFLKALLVPLLYAVLDAETILLGHGQDLHFYDYVCHQVLMAVAWGHKIFPMG